MKRHQHGRRLPNGEVWISAFASPLVLKTIFSGKILGVVQMGGHSWFQGAPREPLVFSSSFSRMPKQSSERRIKVEICLLSSTGDCTQSSSHKGHGSHCIVDALVPNSPTNPGNLGCSCQDSERGFYGKRVLPWWCCLAEYRCLSRRWGNESRRVRHAKSRTLWTKHRLGDIWCCQTFYKAGSQLAVSLVSGQCR